MWTDLFTKLFDQTFASRWAGTCNGWTKELTIAHMVADFFIWFAYMTIPVMLILLAKKRKDIPFNRFFFWFAAFIIGCGMGHLVAIFTSVFPFYYIEFWVKGFTATASIATAWLLWRTYPQMMDMPNPFTKLDEVKQTRDRLEHVLATTLNAFIMMDRAGDITEWNRSAERIFGWKKQEVLGKSVADVLIPEPMRQVYKDGMQQFMTTGTGPLFGKNIELIALTKNQGEILVEISINTVEINNIMVFSAFIKDVSERKKYEDELREYQKMFEISLDMMCVSDGIRLLKVNKAFSTTLGYSEEELLSTPFINFIHPDDLDKTSAEVVKVHGDGISVKGFENRWRTKSGEWRWLNWAATPGTRSNNIVFAIARDVTENRLMADKLKQANAELEQFAYVASHDLKAPLRAVNNLVLWIEEDISKKDLSAETKRHMELIHDRIKRMNGLIEGILQYSRIGRFYKEEEVLVVDELVAEVLDSLDSKNFTIKVATLPKIKGNRVMVFQLFANLIGNAIKHHDRDDGTISITAMAEGDYHQFCVEDDGPGIDSSLHHKLFVMFQTLGSSSPESTGVGLALCKKIVEQVGGRIWINSEKGKGATFCFTWPKN